MADHLAVEKFFTGVNYMESLAGFGKTVASNSQLASELTKYGKDNPGSYIQNNVSSIFNKFTVFNYSRFQVGTDYRVDGHFIGYEQTKNPEPDELDAKAKAIREQIIAQEEREQTNAQAKKLSTGASSTAGKPTRLTQVSPALSNPTASKLIKWGAEKSPYNGIGFQPYALTDFYFCKYYGKIPNNRLITLRRYPYPVGDSLRLNDKVNGNRHAIPIAQAVTWFGGDTGNTLSSFQIFSWDMPWTDVVVEEQRIEGNEVLLSELTSLLKNIPGGPEVSNALNKAYTSISGTDEASQQNSGYEAKLQKYLGDLYTTGPYWNRVYGPVNVINESTRRARGIQPLTWKNTITINFSYSFRSFNGLSPKIVALDLISNFMNLTYNDAQFLGQLTRYFAKPGVKFDPTVTEALGKILTEWGTTATGSSSEQILKVLNDFQHGLDVAGQKIKQDPLSEVVQFFKAGVMSNDKLGGAIPNLISIKSALSDRPVGEWHIVFGNPMNPIFAMGDLICKSVRMAWDDEIGPDDFPTGCTFTVELQQGKPRDKVAIERMLNMGQGKLTKGLLRPSSASDTFGTENTKLYSTITDTTGNTDTQIQEYYANLTEAGKAVYNQFQGRVEKAYNLPVSKGVNVNKDSPVDSTLLMLYYQRAYGKN
jgi:hypothetical protein